MTRSRTALVALGGLLAVASLACASANAGGPAGNAEGNAGEAATVGGPQRLARVVEGFPFWVDNGAIFELSPALTVGVRIGPYPPARDGVMELVLTDPRNAAPVVGATVDASAEMRYMDHGVLRLVGIERTGAAAAPGQYRVPLRFVMEGEWTVAVRISAGETHEELRLLLLVN